MSNVERSLAKSQEYLPAAQRYVPECSQTFSKAPSQYVQGVSPAFIRRAQGCRVWDVDGNEYIDHVMSLDAIVIGYNDPDVVRAVRAQLEDGTIFSLPHPLEIEVARALTEVVPCAQMARFGKNGSDARSGAIRAIWAHGWRASARTAPTRRPAPSAPRARSPDARRSCAAAITAGRTGTSERRRAIAAVPRPRGPSAGHFRPT